MSREPSRATAASHIVLMTEREAAVQAEKVYLCSMCDGKRNHFHLQLIPRLAGDELQGSRVFVKPRGLLLNAAVLAAEVRRRMETDGPLRERA